jgi:hypothetical protein
MEPGGDISVFYFKDEDVRYGLPTYPELHLKKLDSIEEHGFYSCSYCGYTDQFNPVKDLTCPICKKKKWVKSINERRVS